MSTEKILLRANCIHPQPLACVVPCVLSAVRASASFSRCVSTRRPPQAGTAAAACGPKVWSSESASQQFLSCLRNACFFLSVPFGNAVSSYLDICLYLESQISWVGSGTFICSPQLTSWGRSGFRSALGLQMGKKGDVDTLHWCFSSWLLQKVAHGESKEPAQGGDVREWARRPSFGSSQQGSQQPHGGRDPKGPMSAAPLSVTWEHQHPGVGHQAWDQLQDWTCLPSQRWATSPDCGDTAGPSLVGSMMSLKDCSWPGTSHCSFARYRTSRSSSDNGFRQSAACQFPPTDCSAAASFLVSRGWWLPGQVQDSIPDSPSKAVDPPLSCPRLDPSTRKTRGEGAFGPQRGQAALWAYCVGVDSSGFSGDHWTAAQKMKMFRKHCFRNVLFQTEGSFVWLMGKAGVLSSHPRGFCQRVGFGAQKPGGASLLALKPYLSAPRGSNRLIQESHLHKYSVCVSFCELEAESDGT